MFGDEVNATTHGDSAPLRKPARREPPPRRPAASRPPTFVAVDSSHESSGPSAGDIYVGDTADHLVSKFTPSGEIVSYWLSSGQDSFAAINGLAVDGAGNLFVGANLKLSENTSTGFEFRNCEPALAASAHGLAVDGSGNL